LGPILNSHERRSQDLVLSQLMLNRRWEVKIRTYKHIIEQEQRVCMVYDHIIHHDAPLYFHITMSFKQAIILCMVDCEHAYHGKVQNLHYVRNYGGISL
jgi:hypothetical protein